MTDRTFPALHGRPPLGWINDPNGLSRFGDRYHVFFQYNPDAPVHADVTWGHASSTDLLHWRQEPVALRPRPGDIDGAGCWSGCVVDDAGTPTAVYTAVARTPDDAWAALATGSADLRDWAQGAGVITKPDDPEVAEVRDPFVFRSGDHRYVVQGAGMPHPDARPQLLVYRADDLTRWEALGPLLTDDDPIAAKIADAAIWECPNLFPLGDRWVLLISLWRADDRGRGTLAGVRYLVGDLDDTDGLRFVPTGGGEFDDGPAFYAPQVLVEADRVLLWGWTWELDRSPEQIAVAGWCGALTFPRELTLVDGELVSRPAAELVGLRQGSLDPTAPITASAFELIADGPLGLVLRTGDHEQVVLDPASFDGGPTRVLVDASVVEAYGPVRSLTTRAYPTEDSVWLATGAAYAYTLGL